MITIKGQYDNKSESVSWLNLVVAFCLLYMMSTLIGFYEKPSTTRILDQESQGALLSWGLVKSFRFQDEDDNENAIFSILSSARARTKVILAGKCGSRFHSTTSFSENVIVAEKSYKMLESFFDRERAVTSFTTDRSANFLGEKKRYNEAFRDLFLRTREKTLSQISYLKSSSSS